MNAYDTARDELLETFDQLSQILSSHGDEASVAACARGRERLRTGQLLIIVCGEFKSGKSSLINALLSEPDLLPSDIDIATATVIFLREGEERRLTVFTPDGEGIDARELPFEQLSRYASQAHAQDVAEHARSVVVELPNPVLANGLVVADTPGVSGMNRTHTDVTFAALAESDLVLFASDVNRPLTTAEIEFIENRIVPLGRHWILVQTKSDLSLAPGRIVSENREKLKARLPEHWGEVPILAVSSRTKLRFLQTGKQNDLEDSGFDVLEQELWTILDRSGASRLVTRARDDIAEIIDEIRRPLEAELSGLYQHGSPEVARLQAELDDAQRRVLTVESSHAEWRTDLVQQLRDLEHSILHRTLVGKVNDMRRRMKERMQSDRPSIDSDQLAKSLEDDAKTVLLSVIKELSNAVDRIREDVAANAGISLGPFDRECDSSIIPVIPSGLTVPQPGMLSRASKFGRYYSIKVGGLAVTGAIFGGLAGGVIGLLGGGPAGAAVGANLGYQIGGGGGTLTGLFAGWGDAREELRREIAKRRAQDLGEAFGPYMDQISTILSHYVEDTVRNLSRSIPKEFNQKIAAHRAQLQKQRAALETGLQTSREAAVARRLVLDSTILKVDSVASRAEATASSFFAGVPK